MTCMKIFYNVAQSLPCLVFLPLCPIKTNHDILTLSDGEIPSITKAKLSAFSELLNFITAT